MKKILSGLVLASLVVLLVMPSLVLAAIPKPNDCCEINHTIVIGGDTVAPGDVIGAPSSQNPWCDLNEDGTLDPTTKYTNWGMFCMLNIIMTVTDWIFYIFMLITVIMVLVGALNYLTAAGDPEKASKGQKILVYAIIGLAIAVISKLIPSIVRFFIGM